MPEGVRAIVERRRAEQRAAFDTAGRYAAALGGDIPLVAVVVFGSYARGDFNTWSDIDVLVVSDDLPEDPRRRLDLLWQHAVPGVSPLGWTVTELGDRRRRGDPVAVEADAVGFTVAGDLPPRVDETAGAPSARVARRRHAPG